MRLRQVRLKSLKRRARLMYLPAYVADYVFGEQVLAWSGTLAEQGKGVAVHNRKEGSRLHTFPVMHSSSECTKAGGTVNSRFAAQINVHSERKPQRFQAVVSGMDATSVAAERHFSPRKVRPRLSWHLGV